MGEGQGGKGVREVNITSLFDGESGACAASYSLLSTLLSSPCSGRGSSLCPSFLSYESSRPVALYLCVGCGIHYDSLLLLGSDRGTHSILNMESSNALDVELDVGDDMDCDLPMPSLECDVAMDVDALQGTPSGTVGEANPTSATPPGSPFTPTSASASDTSLISHTSGDPASQQNHATPPAQPPRFDPRALLNPTAPPSTSKRPASSGEDADRGRAEMVSPGQLSLVERLHNVHERTTSPAKRVKTDEQKKRASSGFGSGALDLEQTNGQHLQHNNGHTAAKPTAVDLTMSKCHEMLSIRSC